jgi:hypothetical protein
MIQVSKVKTNRAHALQVPACHLLLCILHWRWTLPACRLVVATQGRICAGAEAGKKARLRRIKVESRLYWEWTYVDHYMMPEPCTLTLESEVVLRRTTFDLTNKLLWKFHPSKLEDGFHRVRLSEKLMWMTITVRACSVSNQLPRYVWSRVVVQSPMARDACKIFWIAVVPTLASVE